MNHALTGAVIGLTVENPLLAMPLAFGSHYLMDALPHYDYDGDRSGHWIGTKSFAIALSADAFICLLIVLALFLSQPKNWLLACACAFLAAVPDAFSFMRFLHIRRGVKHSPNAYERFASKIQWFERPIGGVVEIAWFIGVGIVFVALLD